jgi:uncharacterized protein YbaR (Trm112 family)
MFLIVDSVMWLNEIEKELLIFRCNNAYPIAPQLHVKWCTAYVVYFLTACSADTRKGTISETLFNPSFTDWVQNIPSRGIFLNNSRWYRVKDSIHSKLKLFILGKWPT